MLQSLDLLGASNTKASSHLPTHSDESISVTVEVEATFKRHNIFNENTGALLESWVCKFPWAL
jgi:hypothetical protein